MGIDEINNFVTTSTRDDVNDGDDIDYGDDNNNSDDDDYVESISTSRCRTHTFRSVFIILLAFSYLFIKETIK